jgi:hypothetical protein
MRRSIPSPMVNEKLVGQISGMPRPLLNFA